MELSYRLNQIADMVTEGNRVADVGTDHAYIPIKLVQDEKIPCAIAMDIGKGPLERAKEHVTRYHLQDKIECRLSDGLQKLDVTEADTIVIAGMGGDLMKQICEREKERFFGNKEFILQPQSEYYKVRRQIHHMGYRIIEERFFMDEGKYYVCIKAHPGKEQYEKECEYRYGKYLLLRKHPVLKEYIKKRLTTLDEIAQKINQQEKAKTLQKINELQEEREWIKEALAYYN